MRPKSNVRTEHVCPRVSRTKTDLAFYDEWERWNANRISNSNIFPFAITDHQILLDELMVRPSPSGYPRHVLRRQSALLNAKLTIHDPNGLSCSLVSAKRAGEKLLCGSQEREPKSKTSQRHGQKRKTIKTMWPASFLPPILDTENWKHGSLPCMEYKIYSSCSHDCGGKEYCTMRDQKWTTTTKMTQLRVLYSIHWNAKGMVIPWGVSKI
jgi:hypothetical protein